MLYPDTHILLCIKKVLELCQSDTYKQSSCFGGLEDILELLSSKQLCSQTTVRNESLHTLNAPSNTIESEVVKPLKGRLQAMKLMLGMWEKGRSHHDYLP